MKNNSFPIVIIMVFLVLALLTISKHLADPYLWFDEAGQFFISKGLNHYSEPLAEENDLRYVIKNNASYNLDPGGFSLLLHFWSKISNSHIWLRLLPFSFFIGTVLSFIYLTYQWLRDLRLALLMGFIPILMPALRTAVEIRAYSMETLGSLVGIIALERLKKNTSIKNLFLWSLVLSFFITSRYSVIVVIFVISLYVLYLISISDLTAGRKIVATVVYSCPLFSTLIYIFCFSFVFQNKSLEPFGYLPHISNDLKVLFLPFTNSLYLLLLFLLLLLYVFRNRISIVKKHQIILHIAVSTNMIFIVLSFLGIYPWCPFFRRNNSFVSITLLCLGMLLAEFLIRVVKKPQNLNYILVSSLLIIAVGLGINHSNLSRYEINTYSNILTIDIYDYQHIYVDWWESASIRYLFEYGIFRNQMKDIYPERFTFGKGISNISPRGVERRSEFLKIQPRMNEMVEYDLLIAPKLSKQGPIDKWKLLNGSTNFYIRDGS